MSTVALQELLSSRRGGQIRGGHIFNGAGRKTFCRNFRSVQADFGRKRLSRDGLRLRMPHPKHEEVSSTQQAATGAPGGTVPCRDVNG